LTDTDEQLSVLAAQHPRRRLEICPSRFCRLSIRRRMAFQLLGALGPAAIAALFALAEPLLRGHDLPDRAMEIVALLALGILWFGWVVLRGGGRMAMDLVALLESGLTGRSKHLDFEPVFDRANARAQLDAFLDELEQSCYTGTVPIQFRGGEPRRVTATEELDLSLPVPLVGREGKEAARPRSER